MAKCVKCDKRKGKRHCPALGKSICSLCCGQLREKEIHCPPSCSFLAQHKPYQDQRVLEKRHAERPKAFSRETDILSDERLAWLVFNIEVPIAQFAGNETDLVDRDALLALEYVREKVEKEKGLIIVPDSRLQPKNDLGEAIFQSLQQCRYEKKIILPGSIQTYKKEEKIRCLDRVIFAAKQIAGDHIQGQRYLMQLIERLAKLNELSHQPKIITPSS
jgi:hypothetical protein